MTATTRCHNCAMPRSASQYRHRNAAYSTHGLNGSIACSGQVFSSVSLLALRSGLQPISSTTGVSDRRSLPVFRPRIVKDSEALRRSRATGTPSGTYCRSLRRRFVEKPGCPAPSPRTNRSPALTSVVTKIRHTKKSAFTISQTSSHSIIPT